MPQVATSFPVHVSGFKFVQFFVYALYNILEKLSASALWLEFLLQVHIEPI